MCFFSSRRRHTRWPRDWSSDVCSSDLFVDVTQSSGLAGRQALSTSALWFDFDRDGLLDLFVCNYVKWRSERASCRERVYISVVAVSVKIKEKKNQMMQVGE